MRWRYLEKETWLMSNEQEIWRVFPDYPNVEVSNLGRVRTKDRTVTRSDGSKLFVKGRILKQQRDRYGYMFVQFSDNGKRVTLKVHRMVAITFIPNPDNLPQVNHIDCNRSNNIVSNLEWCTNQYNTAYREKYGKASSRPVFAVNVETGEVLHFKSRGEAECKLNIPHQAILAIVKGQKKTFHGWWFTEDESEITEERIREIKSGMRLRPVTAVDLRAMKVMRFENRKEVACQLGISQSSIGDALRGKCKTVKGFLFTEDESEITEEKIREIKVSVQLSGVVIAVNLDTLEVLIFDSQVNAGRQLGISPKSICNVLNGWQETTHRFLFCRANENAVEKVRVKFGDEVAKKVEELIRKYCN